MRNLSLGGVSINYKTKPCYDFSKLILCDIFTLKFKVFFYISGDIHFHRMSTTEDVIAKRQLKDIVGVIMQPDLNKPYLEPKPAYKSGISKDANQYRDRNWGTLGLKGLAGTKHNQTEVGGYSSRSSASNSCDDTSVAAMKPPRIIGSDALDNLRKSHGAMEGIIKGLSKVDYTPERPPSRLPSSEAKDNECRNRGTTMRHCLNSAEDAKFAPPKPRLKLPSKEAEENYHRSQGTVFFRPPSPTVPSRSAGTAGSEPRGRALWNKGICAMVIAGKVSGDPVPAIRVRGDGQDIYWHCHGSKTLLHHNPNTISYVRQQSGDINLKATNSFGGRCQSAAPAKRRPESRRYTRKHPATVADCLRRYLQ